MEGWIKIHRKMKDHWIWKSQNRFQWWIDILLTVNHCDTKVLIKGNLIECKRGQSVRSLETWAKDWNVTKKTVKEFFELLQKDSMLVYESIQISTRITVCNYDSYQDVVNAKETKGKRKVNGAETETTPKQECKEGIKNEKKYIEDEDLNFIFCKFLEMRKEIKKPASEYAIKLLILNLYKLSSDKRIQKAIIEQSIIKNYQGLFAVNGNNGNNGSEIKVTQTTLKADQR